MQINFRIICADSDTSRIQKFLQSTFAEHAQYKAVPYWKVPGCCEITCEYSNVCMDTDYLQNVVRIIAGNDDLDVSRQGDCIEYAVYSSIEKIVSGDKCAFVVCFVNTKEDTK